MVEKIGGQSARQKEKLLKEALSKYKEGEISFTDGKTKEPVLIIDGRPIRNLNCYKALSKLQGGDIYGIAITGHPVPSEYYGQNAINGLIQIWTYNSKK